VQVGTGVQVAGVATNFTQGSLSSTGKSTDLGVSGSGYFVVQDGDTGPTYATRDGSFHWGSDGKLVNAQGFRVLDSAGAAIEVANYATMASISIGTDGTVTAFADDGTSTTAGQIGLLKVPDETKLVKQGNNLYDYASTGAAATDLGVPAADGRGTIQSGTLELSNVDLTEQFSELITTQRSFQAGSRLITVSDTVLEDIVNLKR
jgi:flagellar hook protein FlgE